MGSSIRTWERGISTGSIASRWSARRSSAWRGWATPSPWRTVQPESSKEAPNQPIPPPNLPHGGRGRFFPRGGRSFWPCGNQFRSTTGQALPPFAGEGGRRPDGGAGIGEEPAILSTEPPSGAGAPPPPRGGRSFLAGTRRFGAYLVPAGGRHV